MRHLKVLPVLVLLCLGTVAQAHAGQDIWTDVIVSSPAWNRPTADLQAVAPGPKVPFSSLSLFVTQTGVYEITSDQTLIEPWDGLIFLYAESFDPTQPLKNLIAGNDNGPAGASTSKITVQLMAGVVYHVVTTSATPSNGPLNFVNTVKGPGEVRESYCFLDEPNRRDNGDDTAMSLHGQRFCVSATWKDFAGHTGNAHRVPLRSDDSGNLWFFGPDNWEIQVKIVNGCGLNHNFWVMLSSTSNVEYEIHVRDMFGSSSQSERIYKNALGQRPRTVLDVKAFDGCTGGDAGPR